ncbi:MAG: UMP kinase [Planctomycetes bacterium]|nr:UMP kinase [Planctomycetota bacterium]
MVEKRRLLLKISGEALAAPGKGGIGPAEIDRVARQVKAALQGGDLKLGMVVGGGNFLRGRELSTSGVNRVTADYMGMLATVLNGLALQSALESLGVEARVQSAIPVEGVVEPYVRGRALRHLAKGRVVIFVGGTGNPFFSTDSAAALRAVEIGAQCLLKGTGVHGVYSDDPRKNAGAQLYEALTYDEVLQKRLGVMDFTAISLCRENQLPIVVFNMTEPGNIEKALKGERLGTVIGSSNK